MPDFNGDRGGWDLGGPRGLPADWFDDEKPARKRTKKTPASKATNSKVRASKAPATETTAPEIAHSKPPIWQTYTTKPQHTEALEAAINAEREALKHRTACLEQHSKNMALEREIKEKENHTAKGNPGYANSAASSTVVVDRSHYESLVEQTKTLTEKNDILEKENERLKAENEALAERSRHLPEPYQALDKDWERPLAVFSKRNLEVLGEDLRRLRSVLASMEETLVRPEVNVEY